ncbi:MAG: VTT domain-containing protein [Candidatus Berkelbacteria bacterium]|nr:MAG: VTT domain-containing protein [Candidatus Berkelbacteria bacterium]QQG51515.1 MAG: VTT domain-containing protein [Candidatus Berkelbacteria bacterium]
MIHQIVKKNSLKLPPKHVMQIVGFIFLFGIFIAVVSALIQKYVNPAEHPVVQQLLKHESTALLSYFAYTMVASVFVPIPTLPVDVVLLNIMDPVSVIVVRLAGGLAGSSINFYVARNFGRPLLKRWFSPRNFNFIEELSDNLRWQHFFIITMIPIINTELMAYAGGISHLRFRWVLGTLALALFYRVLFVFFVIHA